VRACRPMQNMERLRRSMRRLMLADFDPGELLPCLQVRARAAAPSAPAAARPARPC
jgi:branched-subunit amino acid aminotransferase/4-amino-4-deoxychorismate lyase